MLQRFRVFPRLPLHAPSRRLDIAQRQCVIRFRQVGLRLVEYSQRVSQLSRLEQKPALLNLDHCRQLVRANRLHQLASPDDMFLRLLVFTLLAMCAPLPEMCNRRQPLIAQFAFRLQHELQYLDCPPQVLLT